MICDELMLLLSTGIHNPSMRSDMHETEAGSGIQSIYNSYRLSPRSLWPEAVASRA